MRWLLRSFLWGKYSYTSFTGDRVEGARFIMTNPRGLPKLPRLPVASAAHRLAVLSPRVYGIGCLGRTAILSLNVTVAVRLHTAVLDLLRDSVLAGHGRAPLHSEATDLHR